MSRISHRVKVQVVGQCRDPFLLRGVKRLRDGDLDQNHRLGGQEDPSHGHELLQEEVGVTGGGPRHPGGEIKDQNPGHRGAQVIKGVAAERPERDQLLEEEEIVTVGGDQRVALVPDLRLG